MEHQLLWRGSYLERKNQNTSVISFYTKINLPSFWKPILHLKDYFKLSVMMCNTFREYKIWSLDIISFLFMNGFNFRWLQHDSQRFYFIPTEPVFLTGIRRFSQLVMISSCSVCPDPQINAHIHRSPEEQLRTFVFLVIHFWSLNCFFFPSLKTCDSFFLGYIFD